MFWFFFSSRRRHTRLQGDWSSDVCSSDLEPAGLRHGRVAMELARRLGNHVDAHRLGRVYAAKTGFTLAREPDTVRAPDIAFVRRERVPDPEPAGFPNLAPDLVVEVLSSNDRPGEVL